MAEVSGQFIYSEELYGLPARTVILIPVRWADLPEAETSLLDKILSAARLSLAGVQVVSTEKVSLSELAIYNPSLVISFGVKLDPETTLYEPKFEGNVTIIRSDRLGDLDDTRKKNLWTALKQLLSR